MGVLLQFSFAVYSQENHKKWKQVSSPDELLKNTRGCGRNDTNRDTLTGSQYNVTSSIISSSSSLDMPHKVTEESKKNFPKDHEEIVTSQQKDSPEPISSLFGSMKR
jgi:hypothetical protein